MSFYEMLNKAIREEIDLKKPSLYSQLRLNVDLWYKHLNKLREETCTDNKFWLDFWLHHEAPKPTEEDKLFLQNKDKEYLEALRKGVNEEYLKEHRSDMLNAIQFVLAISLKYLILNHCGETELARNLNEYWLLGNEELKRRGFEVLDFNPYELDMKAQAIGKLHSEEDKRRLGVCPTCQTKEFTVSNGSMWHCKKCGKNFRKVVKE